MSRVVLACKKSAAKGNRQVASKVKMVNTKYLFKWGSMVADVGGARLSCLPPQRMQGPA